MQQPRVATELSRHLLRTIRTQRPILVANALIHDGTKEPLSSRHLDRFNWYSCGPTVYDHAHLGHARAYVSLDIMRRIITNLTGAHINYALGVTDIDDKILARSKERNVSPRLLAEQYEQGFFEDLHTLNVLPPSKVLRVSEYIPELQQFITHLMSSGAAYSSSQGNVYFAVQTSGPRYGQLDPSRGLSSAAPPQPSTDIDTSEKRDPRDFALWKRADDSAPEQGTWDSPWGRGRPGWHIECSAMAMASLGDYLDMHTGGIDLRFPHHTNELATAEAKLCCCPNRNQHISPEERWSHTWLHVGHLHIRGRKMSKSLKNFISIRDFLEQGGTADAFRIFCLMHKYSSGVEYSDDRLIEAQSYISKLRRFFSRQPKLPVLISQRRRNGKRLSMHHGCVKAAGLLQALVVVRDEVEEALADDFDTPRALSKLSKFMSQANASIQGDGEWESGAAALAYDMCCGVVKDTVGMFGLTDGTVGVGDGRVASVDAAGGGECD
eukprot:GFKZ01013833.1.p1 GENE.GFKZ01013833.1~~GFKZ01013833.1.p1  ORF type:complete len:495 (+),score=49.48 GFKZ01013833.1:571-2055(+)